MKLILTRHGETIENKKGICQGHMPGRLSKEGIMQAKKLALRLKEEKIDAIYSSDLARAIDTAKEIKKFHPTTPLHLTEELRERDHGSDTGKTMDKINLSKRASDAEANESLQARARKNLDRAYNKYRQGTVLFVGHGAINRALISVILNRPASDIAKIEHQFNTAISIFEIREDKKHKVHLMNSVEHLE